MNWGKGIVIAFVLFATVIGSMVVISMKQEVNLVAPDYYKQEIAYQDQINRKENFNALNNKPILKKETGGVLLIKFPKELSNTFVSGDILFFRPSTSKLDRKVAFRLNEDGQQQISIGHLQKGVWKVKISWKGSDEKEYYNESILHI